MLKYLFVLEIFSFLSWVFGYVEKRLDEKAMGLCQNLWRHRLDKNNYNTHIAQYLKKQRQSDNEIFSINMV